MAKALNAPSRPSRHCHYKQERQSQEFMTTDKSVGANVRLFRKQKNVSIAAIAEILGVNYQSVQRFEIGETRIGATRLKMIADFLDVPIALFFEDPEQLANPISQLGAYPSQTEHITPELEEQILYKLRQLNPNVRSAIITLIDAHS